MSTIDLSFKGKLNKDIRERFNELSIFEKEEFDKTFLKLSTKNINLFYYWFRTPSSRNTISSPLFHNYISLIFFSRYIIKKKIKIKEIITDSIVLYKFINEN